MARAAKLTKKRAAATRMIVAPEAGSSREESHMGEQGAGRNL
jgi:hypothetical protein